MRALATALLLLAALYLFVSPRELRTIVAGTGWRLAKAIRSDGPMYVAVLEKTAG